MEKSPSERAHEFALDGRIDDRHKGGAPSGASLMRMGREVWRAVKD